MKKPFIKRIIAAIAAMFVFSAMTINVSCATEEDVLNAIRARGGNDKLVNLAKMYIRSQLSKEGNTYTYDDALNAVVLYDGVIADEWLENPETDAGEINAVTDTVDILSPSAEAYVPSTEAADKNVPVSEDTSKEVVNSLDFSNMTQEQKIEMLTVAAEMGEQWNVNVSVEQVSSDRFEVSLIDGEGYVVASTSLGSQIDDTGIDYRAYLAVCLIALIGSIKGISLLNKKLNKAD